MTDSELKKLAQDANHFYSGMKCCYAEWVLLPFRSVTTSILAMGKFGPQMLDEIFLGLLQNGANTRKKIAARLGVDEDEFIFTHLDLLIRGGYVVENQGVCALTEQGKSFVSGDYREERLQKIDKYKFYWGDMTAQIEADVRIARKLDARELKHRQYLAEDDITDKLITHFNAENRENGVVFYDIAFPEGGRRFHVKKRYAKYAALFYVSKENGNGLCRVDLRMRNKGDSEFRPCKELSRAANEEGYWREQFEKIYAERIGASCG
ncbi:MAG: hypothetical protein OXU29_02915 [Gammaproteobacteria bacterium]|nr:hypothetical protein [Gammaproteobacteria bacterium]MDD9850527.1 hypothetical protein [Gammaproteobacteria bacterium]